MKLNTIAASISEQEQQVQWLLYKGRGSCCARDFLLNMGYQPFDRLKAQ